MNEVAENVADFEAQVEAEDTEKKDPISDEIRAAFKAGVEADKEEDMIKIDMIAAGCKFRSATRFYNELMVEAGLAISKEEKDEILEDVISSADLLEEEGFNIAVAEVVNRIESVNEKSAAAMVRAYARKSNLEYFKKPKGAGGTRTTFITDFYDALLEKPNMSEEEAHQIIVEKGTANTLRWESSHQKVRALTNKIYEKYINA